MAAQAILETEAPLSEFEKLRINAHFIAHGIDVLILPPGVSLALMMRDNCDDDD